MMTRNFIFFGSSDFSALVLSYLIDQQLIPSLVITLSDQKIGRHQVITPSDVKKIALEKKLPVLTSSNQKELTANFSLLALKKKPTFAVLASFGIIIPKLVLDCFPFGIINIHPSLLPKYRGASPLQTAILNGDDFTGVSLMLLTEQLDGGKLLAQERIAIEPKETTLTLGKKLFLRGTQLLVKILPAYLEGKLPPFSQTKLTNQLELTRKFTKADGFINYDSLNAAILRDKIQAKEIDRKFRAFFPWPGIWTILPEGKRTIITNLELLPNQLLKILEVKIEGRNSNQDQNFIFHLFSRAY